MFWIRDEKRNGTGMNEFFSYFNSQDPEIVSRSVKLLLLLTVLSLASVILFLLTSFTRVVIVLAIVRTALGTNQTPPTQIIIGLALFITYLIIAPTFQKVHEDALEPLFANEIQLEEAYERAAI